MKSTIQLASFSIMYSILKPEGNTYLQLEAGGYSIYCEKPGI